MALLGFTLSAMTYEESVLAPGERIIGTFRAHALPGVGFYWLALAAGGGVVAAGVLGGAAVVGLGVGGALIVIWAVKLLDWRNSVLVITNKRVIKGGGILAKHTRDSALDKITDLELTQSILGRVLDYGTLSILTANEKAEDVFRGLATPKVAKSALLDAKSVLENGGGARGGATDGDISAIERLNQRGVLDDNEAKALLRKLLAERGESKEI